MTAGKITPVGLKKGDLRAEPNGSGFNVWAGGNLTGCSKDEAIEFLEKNTTAVQKADKDAIVDWLKKQP